MMEFEPARGFGRLILWTQTVSRLRQARIGVEI